MHPLKKKRNIFWTDFSGDDEFMFLYCSLSSLSLVNILALLHLSPQIKLERKWAWKNAIKRKGTENQRGGRKRRQPWNPEISLTDLQNLVSLTPTGCYSRFEMCIFGYWRCPPFIPSPFERKKYWLNCNSHVLEIITHKLNCPVNWMKAWISLKFCDIPRFVGWRTMMRCSSRRNDTFLIWISFKFPPKNRNQSISNRF
jgi:hypothetical protein